MFQVKAFKSETDRYVGGSDWKHQHSTFTGDKE